MKPEKLIAIALASGAASLLTTAVQAREYSESIMQVSHITGTTIMVEEGHPYFVGMASGAMVPTGEPGLFAYAGVICPAFNDLGRAGGYCVYTIGTGDTATAEWSCEPSEVPAGAIMASECTLNFVSGTGSLTGITGRSAYQVRVAPPNPDGSLSAVGIYYDGFNYQLPD